MPSPTPSTIMPGDLNRQSPSRPRPVPGTSKNGSNNRFSPVGSASRTTSTARLGSPVPSSPGLSLSAVRQIPNPTNLNISSQTPLAGADSSSFSQGPGQSALATALQGSSGGSPPRSGTPAIRPSSPIAAGSALLENDNNNTYGSFDAQSTLGSTFTPQQRSTEDPEVVRRHLVQPTDLDGGEEQTRTRQKTSVTIEDDTTKSTSSNGASKSVQSEQVDREFSSLKLQGGDVTRQVYRWAEEADSQSQNGGRPMRSKSFNLARPQPESQELNITAIKVPGGFRRNYLYRSAPSPPPDSQSSGPYDEEQRTPNKPRLFTNSFIEFLTLYGHFAGEQLDEDDDGIESDSYFDYGEDDSAEDGNERSSREDDALLTPKTPGGRRKHKQREGAGQNTSWGAALLLLKSFVGTGVLFLPKAYLNGGMLFSNLVLLAVALLSYYCFILLINTRLKIDGSFGDIGGALYGSKMRGLILASIVLSQVGFVSAYTVFTSANLQAFILAVSDCRTFIDIKYLVLMQLIIFLPLSLIRDISKLGGTALIADVFILLGLIYLYYYDVFTLVSNHGVADIVRFNSRDWTLFIGTAIFSFEGIGLIIPIQESMKNPSKFPSVLAIIMVIITVIFVSMGGLSYAAYGSATKTVVLLNLPQDDKFVNTVQFLYSLAILLSTPLQLFPAIRIMENALFTRSGKNNAYIKWEKNIFRFFIVMVCATIAWGGAADLDKFVALVGCFACVPLVFVYPVMLSHAAIPDALILI